MTIQRWSPFAGWCLLWALAACSTSDPVQPGAAGGVFGQIDVPELTGVYAYGGPDSSRSTTFPFPGNIASFRELRLVVSGNWSVGTMEIPQNYGFLDTVAIYVAMQVRLETTDDSGPYFEAAVIPRKGEFAELDDIFSACCPRSGLDPAQLLDRELNASLTCVYQLPPNARVLVSPQGQLTDVRLEAVDAVRAEWPPGWSFP